MRAVTQLAILRIRDHRQDREEDRDHHGEALAANDLQRLVLYEREKHLLSLSWARAKHQGHASHTDRSREMLEGVAADDVSNRENLRIGEFEHLGCDVCHKPRPEIAAAWFTRWIQRK